MYHGVTVDAIEAVRPVGESRRQLTNRKCILENNLEVKKFETRFTDKSGGFYVFVMGMTSVVTQNGTVLGILEG